MKITQSATILLTKDIVSSARYFEEKVGFSADLFGAPPNFAILEHGNARLMLALTGKDVEIVPNWKLCDKTSDVYFWVDNIHEVYKELQDKGAIIDFSLYLAPWGVWEFGIQDLDNHDITFGQMA